jgi:hypothetical protein
MKREKKKNKSESDDEDEGEEKEVEEQRKERLERVTNTCWRATTEFPRLRHDDIFRVV